MAQALREPSSVHAPSRKLILTNKKSLVNSELPVLADIGEAKAGMVCHAYVSKVQDNGIVVAFFGPVKGFAMLSELGIDRDSEAPSQVFRVNQVFNSSSSNSSSVLHAVITLLRGMLSSRCSQAS